MRHHSRNSPQGKTCYAIVPVAGAKISDLDLSAFAEFMLNFRNLEISQFDEPALQRLLENLSLVVKTDFGLQPTIAGLLLFGKNKVKMVFTCFSR